MGPGRDGAVKSLAGSHSGVLIRARGEETILFATIFIPQLSLPNARTTLGPRFPPAGLVSQQSVRRLLS